jgi:hypothetical protein
MANARTNRRQMALTPSATRPKRCRLPLRV